MSDDEIRKIANEHTVEYDSDDGETSHSLDLYSFSRAIRREAFEEAAQRVMKILGYPPREYYAEAIRALSKDQTK